MASEVRLINATPIKKFIENGLNCKDPLKAFGHDAIEILTEIEFTPAIDPESLRPKGRWVSDEGDVLFHCSECETQISTSWDYDDLHWNYCPNCGAKMEG